MPVGYSIQTDMGWVCDSSSTKGVNQIEFYFDYSPSSVNHLRGPFRYPVATAVTLNQYVKVIQRLNGL